MIERTQPRIELNQTILIHDVINGGVFGELVNVTTEGMMIMTERDIPTNAIYQLSLQLPVPICELETIDLGAECLWCRDESHFKRHWAGFHIIDVSDIGLNQLEMLIEYYGKS